MERAKALLGAQQRVVQRGRVGQIRAYGQNLGAEALERLDGLVCAAVAGRAFQGLWLIRAAFAYTPLSSSSGSLRFS